MLTLFSVSLGTQRQVLTKQDGNIKDRPKEPQKEAAQPLGSRVWDTLCRASALQPVLRKYATNSVPFSLKAPSSLSRLALTGLEIHGGKDFLGAVPPTSPPPTRPYSIPPNQLIYYEIPHIQKHDKTSNLSNCVQRME